MVPMNDDINIYDGRQIEGSSEAKSRNTWVEMFDMIGSFFYITINKSQYFFSFSLYLMGYQIGLSQSIFCKINFDCNVKQNFEDLAINNLQQQNKDLKRQVNELNSKVNKVHNFKRQISHSRKTLQLVKLLNK